MFRKNFNAYIDGEVRNEKIRLLVRRLELLRAYSSTFELNQLSFSMIQC